MLRQQRKYRAPIQRERTRQGRVVVATHLFDHELRAIRILAAQLDTTGVTVITQVLRHALTDADYVRHLIAEARKVTD